MAGARPSRDQVVAWMRKTGKGQKMAAKHFGIPVGTIKTWLHRARIRGETPGTQDAETCDPGARPGTGEGSPPAVDHRAPETAARALDDIAGTLADAARVRAVHLAQAASVGRGEKDTAIALGIIVDKLKIIREMEGGSRPGPGAAGGPDAARRVLRALGGGGPDDPR